MNSRKTKGGENKKLKQSIKAASSTIKTAFKKTAVLVMSTALITYPIDFSYVHAYFTDRIVYGSRNSTPGLLALNALERGAVELCFDIHRFTDLKIDVDVKLLKGLLLVELTLPEGFGYTADDIIQNSLELFYDEEIIDTTPTDIETDGNEIKVTYDWDKVERAIDSDDNSPTFELSGKGEGKGVSGLGERFIFKGQGKIADLNWEYFDQLDWSFEIQGVDEITVSAPGEGGQSYFFRFIINGRQVPDDEVEWRLSSDIPGVSFRAGELIVSSSAESGEIVLYAELKSNRYFARKFAIQLIKPEVELPPESQPPVEGEIPGEPDAGKDTYPGGSSEDTPNGGTVPGGAGGDNPGGRDNGDDDSNDGGAGKINPPVNPPKDEDDHEDDGKGVGGRDEDSENDDGDTQDDEADDPEDDGKDDAGDQGGQDDGTNDDGEDMDQPGNSGEDDTNGDDNGSGDDNTPTDDDSSDEDTTGSGDTEEGVGASTPTNGDDTPDGDNEVTGGDGTSPEDTGDNDEDGSDNDGAGKDKKDGINEDEGIRYEGLGDENKTDIDDDCYRQDQGPQNEYTKTGDSDEQGVGFYDTS